ncbi:phosphatidylinositol glycan anchor biosynthesis, class C [Seminavis robusta]|uniref:Phosphatidylinositol glycan anchor biosynthesis, class C n=1 Tax=Seminavis robusta TaxID=568900 RepID=A0A9N8EY33_9STRA|nr:phosphatidylinositol glycan anchor biosynthesis, class C [Seminavis robusta]|eukprot:Sro2065_g313200.1 phosphatidylinositol glycan anchor biosynthesis, class C (367) ;mRNA; r:4116-5216
MSTPSSVSPPSQQRTCWRRDKNNSLADAAKRKDETYQSLLQEFSSTLPPKRSLTSMYRSSVTVAQEFALTCLFLARHRVVLWEDELLRHNSDHQHHELLWIQQKVNASQLLALLALILIAIFTNSRAAPPPPQTRKAKVLQRLVDAIFSALFLRIQASVLQTLTASFSTDTVERLTVAGMVIHLVTCDYAYANGIVNPININTTADATTVSSSVSSNKNNDDKLATQNKNKDDNTPSNNKRPTFQGGTVSLNAAFFSTILLASRLSSNAQVYVFVSLAIILFAFFPAARHAISQHPHGGIIHSVTTLLLALSTACLLQDKWECLVFAMVLFIICGIAPLCKLWLQQYKQAIRGPWEVVTVADMMLD